MEVDWKSKVEYISIMLYEVSDLNFCCLSPPIRSIVQIIVKLAPFCTVNSRCCFPSYLDPFLIVKDYKKKKKKNRKGTSH